MCLAVAGVIKTLDKSFAYADIQGIETKINVELIEEAKEGDYVLIHAGFAIEKIDKSYFNYLDKVVGEILKEEDSYEHF